MSFFKECIKQIVRKTITESSEKQKETETTIEETENIELKCKTRNCKNKRDELCSMNMCSVCCLRIQRKAIAFNEKNEIKKRV